VNTQVTISETLDLSRYSNESTCKSNFTFSVNSDFKKFFEFAKAKEVKGVVKIPEDIPSHYTLRSFITHVGSSCKTGHYISYVNDEWKWVKCDDEALSWSEKDLASSEMESNVYILFYELNSVAI
jgi:ubiquitin C-terminal hydrolase